MLQCFHLDEGCLMIQIQIHVREVHLRARGVASVFMTEVALGGG